MVGGSNSGSATTDSSRNLPRQLENASQYATGIPMTNNMPATLAANFIDNRSEEHTSELQSPDHLVCRLLLEKKKNSITASPPLRANQNNYPRISSSHSR